jgi:hypothetical protein
MILSTVAGEQLGRRAPPRLLLEIDVGERLPVVIADDEAGLLLSPVCHKLAPEQTTAPGGSEVRLQGPSLSRLYQQQKVG